MPFNLTPASATYSASGKFGSAISGGDAYGPTPLPAIGQPFTISGWFKKNAATADNTVPVGQLGVFYLQQNTSTGCWNLTVVSGGGTISSSTTPTLDTNWHHFEIGFTGSTVYLFIDGILQGSAASAFNGTRETNPFCVHAFGTGNFRFNGLVDEVAVWNSCLHTTAFTPPTAATSDSASGLRALYHLDDNANDSAGAVAPSPTVSTVSVSPSTASLSGGGTQTFTATVSGTSSPAQTVTWSASGGSINSSGVFTAPAATGSAQTVTITATSTVDATKSGTATVTVEASGATPTVSSVTVSPSTANVAGGATQQFSATVTGANSPSQAVNWTVSAGTINASGLFTAPEATASAQTITITATSQVDGTKSGAATAIVPATAAPVTGFTDNILFSPFNWDVTGTSAFSNHSGAYFRTIFSGNSCVLSFDITGIQYLADVIEYRVDADDWVLVPLAASVTISIPSRLVWGASSVHLLEVRINKFSFDNTRWVDPVEGVKLTGVTIDSGATLSKPAALPQSVLVYGDSITEGFRTIDAYLAVTARHSWAYVMAEVLGVELGMAAFTGQGFTKIGNGNIPALPSTYDKLYPGKDRTFNPAPDLIVINMGTNDPYNQATIDAAVGVVNGLLAKTPSTTKIAVLRLFGGRATEMQAVVATVNSPRVSYIDTAGFFVPTAASGEDRIHPRAFDNRIIGPRMAAAVKPLLPATTSAPPATSARTVTLALGNESGPLANLTGLKVAFYDEPTPDLHTAPRFKAANVTTNASGVMSLAVQSTLTAGGSGSVVVQMADGRNLVRTVTVA
ncbi:LamG-like jellyroll fold domain-containing protein [Massilia sp. UBA6681]|uniref:LamG-like jellyroll fold domain-containing protein n=1 Tax=Massilia sp. UBA6681 TaxID=1946839 RepID=UPI0025C591E9|nr:LamG-like jellyroll fold domain-containing protein [Massilia sp. UBA6681]